METGKVSDSVLKRSVIKLIDFKHPFVSQGAGIGNGCSIIKTENGVVCTATAAALTGDRLGPYFAVIRAVNSVLAADAKPVSAQAVFILCEEFDERRLKALTRLVQSACSECNIQLAGGHTQKTEHADCDMVTVTVTGIADRVSCVLAESVRPGMDIVISRSIAMETAAILYDEKTDELLKTLPENYVESSRSTFENLTLFRESEAGIAEGAFMLPLSIGGVFATLWRLSEMTKTGLDVDIKAIPVRQEIIEFCEIFDINPYMAPSAGSMLFVTADGNGLIEALRRNGVSASVIGRTTDNNDKIIRNGDEVRYLDKP